MGNDDTLLRPEQQDQTDLTRLPEMLATLTTRPVLGQLTSVIGNIIRARLPNPRIGELCLLRDNVTGQLLRSEVVGIQEGSSILIPLGDMHGFAGGAEIIPTGETITVKVGGEVLGRTLDAFGNPIDLKGDLPDNLAERALYADAPNPMTRSLICEPLQLGVRALDGLLTCGKGQRIGIYGEPGDGKSSLLAQIVKGTEADICVIGLVGERGREVREFVEYNLGDKGMERTTLVVATSDRPAMERVKAAYTATTIAEAFRDSGKDVLLIVDSITRFARAQREVGLAAGEPPTRRGFPPSVFSDLPKLLERSGPSDTGSITAFYSVLVEGDGSGDPISEETRGILDGHYILSRDLASKGHYPAIDVLNSKSRVMDSIVSTEKQELASAVRESMARFADLEFLIQVGEYQRGTDEKSDRAIKSHNAIEAFLRQGRDEHSTLSETDQRLRGLVS
ncbi:MAG: FliI/YscN family ATPase [Pseudomonadota bacterium]